MNNRLPVWFNQAIPEEAALSRMRTLSKFNVNTVCRQAKCPNQSICFKDSRLTFMILGDSCTRSCRFCAVNSQENKSLALDLAEPFRIAEAAKELGLRYVVITSVSRDDLDDGGAFIFAKTIDLIHAIKKDIKIEVLIPDFLNKILSLKTIVKAHPSVVAHNIETVRRLHKQLKPQASYKISLEVLRKVKELEPSMITKSSILLGLGEKQSEVIDAMEDLRCANCDILTLGQYLAPSVKHYPIGEFISLEQFKKYSQIGALMGFRKVLSGPLVRSSYQAEEVYREIVHA